jgi:peptide/nickel transport system permease protein
MAVPKSISQALTWLAFILFWLIPSDPWRAVLNDPTRSYSATEIAAANHKLGVDRPVIVQYGKFTWGIVRHFDFGKTSTGYPVTPAITSALPVTWSIVFGGALILFLLAVPLGTISALYANTALDRGILLLRSPRRAASVHHRRALKGVRDERRTGCRTYYCPLRGSAW